MLLRHVSRRDAALVLIGASCFFIFSTFASGSQQNHSIIINTHPQYPTAPTAEKNGSPAPLVAPLDLGLVPSFPETTVVAHAPGWTIFQNLYMSDGALLLLTSDPSKFPEHRLMTSTGLPGNLTNDPQRIPTAREMAFVTPEEARARWGGESFGGRNRVRTVEGTTVRPSFFFILSWMLTLPQLLFNDPPQFLNHCRVDRSLHLHV
jgi:hypothetical protein